MVEAFRSGTARIWFAALYALATIVIGFAHRMPEVAPPAFDLAAYVLPDGTTPVLCAADQDGEHRHGIGSGCDACRIADAPGLALPEPDGPSLPSGARVLAGILAESALVASSLHKPWSRGPPAARSMA